MLDVGMADSLIARLSVLPGIVVLAPGSVGTCCPRSLAWRVPWLRKQRWMSPRGHPAWRPGSRGPVRRPVFLGSERLGKHAIAGRETCGLPLCSVDGGRPFGARKLPRTPLMKTIW
jgi:hypothetical protein